jgi:anti-sigma B factor antagonist
MDCVKQAQRNRILLSFAGVTILSSAMISQIILFYKKCKTEEIDLKICSVSPNIMEVFKIVRLNKLIKIYDNEEKALATFGKRGLFGFAK